MPRSAKRRLRLFSCLACGLTLALAAPSQAANPHLEAALLLYEDLEFEAALEQLTKAAAFPGNTTEDEVRIALYRGILRFEMGNEEALVDFKTALALNPGVELPATSPKVEELFTAARAQILAALPQAASPKPEPSAAPDLPPPPPLPAVGTATASPPAGKTPAPSPGAAPPAAALDLPPPPPLPAVGAVTVSTTASETAPPSPGAAPPASAPASAVGLAPEPRAVPPEAIAGQASVKRSPPKRSLPAFPFVLLGAGVALGGGGAYFGASSSQAVSDARAAAVQTTAADHLDSARNRALAANLMYGAAGLSVVSGLIALIVEASISPSAD